MKSEQHHTASILILCTGNSCRSQMAEAIIRKTFTDVEVCSAGVQPAPTLSKRTIFALEEKGYSTKGLYAKDVLVFEGRCFDLVITVCNNANERCPFFPGAKQQIHAPFDDPHDATGTEEEILAVYRRVRNDIEEWVRNELERFLFQN